jgi:hypothetical protein
MNLKEFVDKKLTFKYHTNLNSKFWSNNKLDSKVRMRLIQIAREWAKFASIPESAIKDIIFVGGNANYNYTEFSDIDLHLVVDKDKLPDCPDLIDDFLKDKKQLWALTHDIKIYGHDVELYAEEEGTERPANQGVYSVKFNKWLMLPKKMEKDVDFRLLKTKSRAMMDKIDFLIQNKSNDFEELEKLKTKIREMRSAGIRKGGEFSIENLVFKELRNSGYLDKLSTYITKTKDRSLSLESYDC